MYSGHKLGVRKQISLSLGYNLRNRDGFNMPSNNQWDNARIYKVNKIVRVKPSHKQ